jgi:predicted RNA-binding Zn ribbon-like protein
MAVEIANINLDEGAAAVSTFLERWGLPIIKDDTKLASMALADFHDLVCHVRDAVADVCRRDGESFKAQFEKHAFFAAQPRSNPKAPRGEPRVFIECRDPAAMAWLQLAQRERIGAEYRRCSACDAYFVVSGNDGHRRSRQYCSDRCRVAANRARKSAEQ